MNTGQLGRQYQDRDLIVQQGESSSAMYVVQEGQVEVFRVTDGREVSLVILPAGEPFGEMGLVDGEVRSASVRAVSPARVLTVDKKTFLRRVHEDPAVAFRIMQKLCHRIRQLDFEITRLRSATEAASRSAAAVKW